MVVKRKFSGIQPQIPSEIHYNHKMQKTDCSSFFQKLASTMEQDLSFKEFHQNNCKKGVFRLVKSTFGEMVELLKSFESKLSPVVSTDLGQTLQRGEKAFGYYQSKLFTWISVWLIHRHNITYNQIVNKKNIKFTASFKTLQIIFNNKHPLLLRYKFFLVMALIKKQTRGWGVKENRIVQSLIIAYITEKGSQAVNWKLISFRLFEKQYLRTPHQCRERWINHLDPRITKRKWTPTEDFSMLQLYKEYGPKWSLMAKIVTHRNEHMIKNRFNALQRNWLKKNPDSPQMFLVDRLLEEVGEMLQNDHSFEKTEMKQRRRRKKSSRRKDTKKKKEVSVNVQEASPANITETQVASSIESVKQLAPQKNLNLSSCDQFLQHLIQFQTQMSFTFNCVPQVGKQQYIEHQIRYWGQKFSESDYEWLDKLMEERNKSWMQLQNM